MADHPSTDAPDHNLPIRTVGEISQQLKRHVEGAFGLVRVRGELTGFKRAASGHLYFSLKDETAVLDGVCWRNAAVRLAVRPADGMEVVATGRLTTYPGRSKYQMIVEAMEMAGEGALLKLLEDRRRALAAEGLFDEARKKRLPFLPEVIGVVTSPTGAVIRDILHRLGDRFPRRVLLWPVLVQGQGAAEQVAAAIAGFNRLPAGGTPPRPDLLIVARGGGSLEDLWAFNEEIVVRAAAASDIPLISAVGHETDTTLIDFAADRRAPTPTAAAEMAVPVRIELLAQVLDAGTRLLGAITRTIGDRRQRLEALVRGLPKPARLIGEARQRLDDWSERLANGLAVGLDRRRTRLRELAGRLVNPAQRIALERNRVGSEARALDAAVKVLLRDRRRGLDHLTRLLAGFSYQRVLERGFVLVHDRTGRAVLSVGALKPGMGLGLRFHDGEAAVTVDDGMQPRKRHPSRPPATDDGQGTLL
ncbi:MAG: exodeoxyribonuclease VII large subunit [Rhodospirillales bacterium]